MSASPVSARPAAPAAAARLARASRQRPPLPQRVPRPLAAAPDPRLQRHAARRRCRRRSCRRTSTAPATPDARRRLREAHPDRAPGTAGRARARRSWFRDADAALRPARSPRTRGRQNVPGLGARPPAEPLGGRRRASRRTRSSSWRTATTPASDRGRTTTRRGTAALVELARGYAQARHTGGPAACARRTRSSSSRPTAVATAASAPRASPSTLPFHVVAIVNLDAIAGTGPPRHRDRRRRAALAGGDARRDGRAQRVLEQTGARRATRAGLGAQLIDLGFPFTLYEQGPFVARGIPAVTLTTAGERPPDAFADRPGALDGTAGSQRWAAPRRSSSARSTRASSSRRGRRASSGPATGSSAAGRSSCSSSALLLIPFVVGVVDLFAHCRRRGIALGPGGAQPAQPPRRSGSSSGSPSTSSAVLGRLARRDRAGRRTRRRRPPGDWPVARAARLRVRRVPRRGSSRASASSPGDTVGADERARRARRRRCSRSASSRCSFWQQTRSRCSSSCPPLHAWLWLPQVRTGRAPARALVFALGLVGPAPPRSLSLAIRYGLGFDAPWYLLELAATRLRAASRPSRSRWRATACAAQLAAAAAGPVCAVPAPPASGRRAGRSASSCARRAHAARPATRARRAPARGRLDREVAHGGACRDSSPLATRRRARARRRRTRGRSCATPDRRRARARPPSALDTRTRANELVARVVAAQRATRGGPGRKAGAGLALAPASAQQRRAHEELEADERRDRVARAARRRACAPRTANATGLPGPHRDAPEHLARAELGERAAHEIVRADRHAARGDQHVRVEPRARAPRASPPRRRRHASSTLRARPRPTASCAREQASCSTRRSRPAPSCSPGARSSVPVASTATRGRRAQRTVATPTAASAATCGGPSRVPAGDDDVPRCARRRRAGERVRRRATRSTSTSSPSARVSARPGRRRRPRRARPRRSRSRPPRRPRERSA